MGAVYKARQPRLDRLVALKILAPDRVQDPAFAERFTREARTLAKMSHPHIVGIHDFGEAEGLYFFVMEYVDGASLREVMQTGRLSPPEALELVPQICGALQYAHEAGVVHRDVKPENILLDRSGGVKIADFGLAKLLEPDRANGVSLTGSGAVMGTPAYMAPEQIEHPLDVDHRADIYAVGVVFYEMLTGELPLGRFDPPSHKVRLDVRLDHVVLRALEKEPTRRYQVAGEVTADLERLEAGREISAEPPAAVSAGVGEVEGTRTVTIARPPLVSWIAAYSFLASAACALGVVAGLVYFAEIVFGVARSGLDGGIRSAMSRLGPPGTRELLIVTSVAGLGALLSLWHLIAAFGALRLRNWARYNLVVLMLLELPGAAVAPLTWLAVGFIPTSVLSLLILIYLFRPAVARIFELGPGPASLPAKEADALERLYRRSWT
jgi:hypothetical protein